MKEHHTKKEVMDRSKQTPANSAICKWRLNWLGHVSQLPHTTCLAGVIVDVRRTNEERQVNI